MTNRHDEAPADIGPSSTNGRELVKADGALREPDHGDQARRLLDQLVREHGKKQAAVMLDVGYQTLRRSIKAGQPTGRLRLALEHHLLLRQREQAKVARADVDLGQDVSQLDVKELLVRLVLGFERLERAVASTQSAQTSTRLAETRDEVPGDMDRVKSQPQPLQTGDSAQHSLTEPTTEKALESRKPTHEEIAAQSAKEALLNNWRYACILEGNARNRLERAAARERTLQIELAIIWRYGETIPPGGTWSGSERDEQREWRWRVLNEVNRERRRLARRRRLRRLLSVGLWRS